ncbi:hypothetical protein [Leptospira perolatii]|uniref:hypothetical protein n=1 Tax=Leptospira perolatii TaxID=2023191 RepID=UPI001A9C9BED|nr:hypothetical protein [Leptospira perolatii]
MNRYRIPANLFFLLALLCAFKLQSQDQTSNLRIYKDVIVEDFENFTVDSKMVKEKLGPEFFPEVRISNVLHTQQRESAKSLYIEVKAEKNQSFQILFPKPWSSSEFVKEFTFHIYANEGGGSLYVLLRDSTLDIKKILVAHLLFSGWKALSIDVSRKIRQDDLVTNKHSELQLLGFLYEAPFERRRGTREIFVIDDIIAKVRPKYLLFQGEKTLVR